MSDEWMEGRLGDVVELKRGYDLPERERGNGLIPIVSSSGISGYHSEWKVSGPGVVTGRYGTLGQVFYVTQDFWPLNTTLYVRDFKGNDPRFISYLLRTIDFLAYSDKAAVPGLNRNHLHEALVRWPRHHLQLAIANALGVLDDKIDLNRRMNDILEAMVQALFKSWFIDFDPVRAKMTGRAIIGIDPVTADMFPDKFEANDIGLLPAGWRSASFEDLFAVPLRNGLTKPKQVRGMGTYMVNMRELFGHRRIGDIPMDRVPMSQTEVASSMLEAGDLLFARQSLILSGAGQCSLVTKSEETRTFESHLIRCRIDRKKAQPLVYFYYFWTPQGQSLIKSIVNQVAAAGIRSSDLARLRVPVPPPSIQARFVAAVDPIEQRILHNDAESRQLATLRDLLLPKLLSGELRMSDAEHEVSRVA